MKGLFAWIEKGDELLQSYLGLFLTSSLLLVVYVIYSYLNPVGLHHPGVYIMLLAYPTTVAGYLIISNKKYRFRSVFLLIITLCIAVVDTLLRTSGFN